MNTSFDSFQKRRLRSSYASVVISISLVLFMLGILGLILLKSTKVANHFKEEIVVSLFLKDSISEKQTENLRTALLEKPYTRTLFYVSKENAAKAYMKDLGEDFLEFLGDNPLKNGIDLYLKADYVTPEKMENLANELSENQFISEVNYNKPLVNKLTENIKKISLWLLIASGFVSLVAILLINYSIRLSIYAKRFNIKTMQMVGATKKFIRKPFILQSIKLGFIASLIALAALGLVIFYVNKYIPTLQLLGDHTSLTYVAIFILLISFVITWLSTFFATQRFLNLQTNDLYY